MSDFTHPQLVTLAERWLRQDQDCTIVITEPGNAMFGGKGELPDAIGWMRNKPTSIIVECKVSRADFAADLHKGHRQRPQSGVGVFRWYLTPPGLVEPFEVEERGWGLLETNGPEDCRIVHAASPFHRYAVSREILLMNRHCSQQAAGASSKAAPRKNGLIPQKHHAMVVAMAETLRTPCKLSHLANECGLQWRNLSKSLKAGDIPQLTIGTDGMVYQTEAVGV